MQDVDPKDELAGIRKFLRALESGTKIIRGGADITAQEIHFLKLEIAYLEKVLTETKDGPQT